MHATAFRRQCVRRLLDRGAERDITASARNCSSIIGSYPSIAGAQSQIKGYSGNMDLEARIRSLSCFCAGFVFAGQFPSGI
jgi:hypothetical protein